MPSNPVRSLHAAWRLGAFLIILTLFAGLVAGLFVAVHFPPQRSHGILQPLPMLGTGVALSALALVSTLVCLRFLERRPLATVGLPTGRPMATGILVGLTLGAIVPLTVAGLLWVGGRASILPADLSAQQLLADTLPIEELPRGPVLPNFGDSNPRAAAAGKKGRYSSPHRSLCKALL